MIAAESVLDRNMTIRQVESKYYRLPLSHPMTDATHGVMTDFEVVIVRLESECGPGGSWLHLYDRAGRGGNQCLDRV